MKKLFVIFLVSLFLFSCSVSQLTDAMGKMGQNVMGDYVNTEAVDEVTNAATTVTPKETKTEDGKTELTAITDKDGNSIKVELGSKTVTSILPSLSDDVKNNIIEATSSDGGAKNLAETLNNTKITDETTKAAAKGTATVLSAVLTNMTSTGTLSASDNEANAAIKDLTDKLDKLSDESSEVSAADVIALQAVTALVNQMASSATIDSTSGTITGMDLSVDDNKDLVSSALDTVTVIQAVNPVSIISSEDFETLIKALVKSEDSSRSFEIELKYADAIRNFYTIYKTLFGDGINKNKISVMSLYSGATDIYVGLNGQYGLSGQVADIDRIIQYILSSFFSKAEYLYGDLAAKYFDGDDYPKSLSKFVDLVVEKNPWIADSSLDAKEFNTEFGIKYKDDADYKSLINGIMKDMVSSGNTIKNLLLAVKLDSFSTDIESKINQIPDFLNEGIDYEWK